MESELVAGPLWSLRRSTVLAATRAGTLVTDEIGCARRFGALGTAADVLLLLRRLIFAAQQP